MAEQKGKHSNFTRLSTMGKENKHLDKNATQTEIKGEKNKKGKQKGMLKRSVFFNENKWAIILIF